MIYINNDLNGNKNVKKICLVFAVNMFVVTANKFKPVKSSNKIVAHTRCPIENTA